MITDACRTSSRELHLDCQPACLYACAKPNHHGCMQFLYDLWWGHISPDTEFPKDVRRVLNSAFGELAMRAQQVDLKRMLLT